MKPLFASGFVTIGHSNKSFKYRLWCILEGNKRWIGNMIDNGVPTSAIQGVKQDLKPMAHVLYLIVNSGVSKAMNPVNR